MCCLCSPSAICSPGEAPAQLAARGNGPSRIGMKASPQEQEWQARLQDHSLEQAAEGWVRFHPQWNVWPLCQSVAHAAGLGEQGISPNLLEVLNKLSFIIIFSYRPRCFSEVTERQVPLIPHCYPPAAGSPLGAGGAIPN